MQGNIHRLMPDNFHQTCASQISSAKMKSCVPEDYRLARKPNGEIILQGAFVLSEGVNGGIEWEEIPMVYLDEKGCVISQEEALRTTHST